jgi:2',3'-cyclic-nucleotide 2'-phosphodiesterase (5'-nucleotidase family)
VVDGGGLYWRSGRLPESQLEAAKLKGALVAERYAAAGIDAVGLTPADLAIGWAEVQRLAGEHGLPYLAANLVCGEAAPFPGSVTVERGGVSLGIVGAYLGALPDDMEACSAGEPVPAVASAVAALGEVDAVLVLGAWDEKDAQALVEAVPAVDFVVAASNLTLSDGRALTRDDWMFSAGSRGKKIGLLEATLVPGAQGWQGASPGAELASKIDSYKRRLQSNEEKLATKPDDKRAQRQVGFYTKEIERLEAELAMATAPREQPANTFVNSLESLGKNIEDHAETLAKVEVCNAELEEKGLVAEKQPPKVVDLPVMPGRPGGAAGRPAGLPLRGGPIGQEAPPPSPQGKAKPAPEAEH